MAQSVCMTTWQGSLLGLFHFIWFICCLVAMFLPHFSATSGNTSGSLYLLQSYNSYNAYTCTYSSGGTGMTQNYIDNCFYDSSLNNYYSFTDNCGNILSGSDAESVYCPASKGGAQAASGIALFLHSIAVGSHFGLFIAYIIYDCCAHPRRDQLRRATQVMSVMAAACLGLAFFISFGIFTAAGANKTEGGLWWTFVNAICSALAAFASFKYKGGKILPPPAPKAATQSTPTIIYVQAPPGGIVPGTIIQSASAPGGRIILPAIPAAQMISQPAMQPAPIQNAYAMAQNYALLVHGVGQHPVKVNVAAQTLPDLLLGLKGQLGISQEFVILYTDPDFKTTAQLMNIVNLPNPAEITLQFSH